MVTVLQLHLDIRHNTLTNKSSLQSTCERELLTVQWQQFSVQLCVAIFRLPQFLLLFPQKRHRAADTQQRIPEKYQLFRWWGSGVFSPFTETVSK